MVRQPQSVKAFALFMFWRSHSYITVGRTPLDEWSARRSELYLTTHNRHKRQTSMLLAGFEPAVPAGERSQPHALDRAVTGIGRTNVLSINKGNFCLWVR